MTITLFIKKNNVNLCPEGKEIAKKSSLLFVIHNHPSNIPLQSHADIMSFVTYNIKYNMIYTPENGITILKNNGADYYDIKMGWEDTFQKMRENYIKNDYESYKKECNNFYRGIISHKEFSINLNNNVVKHMENNINLSMQVLKENMEKYNVASIYINH